MRVLVTGASGMLGGTLVDAWRDTHEVFATGGTTFATPHGWRYRAFDLSCGDYGPLIEWSRPEAIVHCAALTSVDGCESQVEHTLDLNGRSVARLRAAAPGARLVFISSDAVLGDRTDPAREDAPPTPLNVYGRSKLLGESLIGDGVAVRTTVVGWNRAPAKQSFVEWVVRTLARGESITLFEDALFNPIAAADLARELAFVLTQPLEGVIHISGSEGCSKYAFGIALCARMGFDTRLVRPGRLASVQFKARRSADQRLDVTRYTTRFGRHLPTTAETVDTLARTSPDRLESAR